MRAADFRKYVADCIEIAGRLSVQEQRARVLQMAERWNSLAEAAEAEEAAAAEATAAEAAIRRATATRVLS
jgi:hypothetical protein